jgi:hypothetical protein
MATFAVINGDIVTNTILADSQEIAEQCNPGLICVEYTTENPAGIGWTYDGTAFTAPVTE